MAGNLSSSEVNGGSVKIAIIGAGIGGLCTAAGMYRAGADVTVFERAPQVRAGGSGITVFGNGMRALDAIGVGEAFREIASTQAAVYRGGQRRPDGTWLTSYPPDAVSQLRVVDREPLHRILRDAVPGSVLQTGCNVSGASPDGRLMWVDDKRAQRSEHFDVVVAADGIGSRIRRSWPTDPGISYSGYSTWRGITETPVDLNREAGETWGAGRRFGVTPLADGRVYWFAVLSVARDHPIGEHRTALSNHFGNWHHPIPEVLAATGSMDIHYLPIDELAGRMPSFVRGQVVLLGDAAHAMTPNLGQGGGQAMEDAATLTALLKPLVRSSPRHDAEIHAALRRYDELRVKRTQKIAQRSRMVGRLAHVPGGALVSVRDVILRAVPGAALRRQLAWLQDWEPPR